MVLHCGAKVVILKILIITPWYPNSVHLQDGNFVRAQAVLLAEKHEVEVICVYEGARTQVQCDVEKSKVRVVRAEYPRGGLRAGRLLRRRKAWQQALKKRALSPDLIHAHVLIDGGIVADRLAKKLNVPFIVTEHSHRWLQEWPSARLPEWWLARRAARRAACLLPVSPSLLKGMQRHGINGQFEVVPNVVETELFYPAVPEAGRPFTFLHVSDFSPNKNIPGLLLAFLALLEQHPQARLHIAGNGDQQEVQGMIDQTLHLRSAALKSTAGRKNIAVSGPHQPHEVAELMRSADAFLLASGVETQSLVLIEALLSGLPCVSTRCGGPEDILNTPFRGELVRINDVAGLCAAMLRLADKGSTPYPTRQLRSNAAREEFGSVAAQLSDIYQRIAP